MQSNALQNMTLMGLTLNKMFRLDDSPFEDEVLHPLNKLYEDKKSKIINFFKELLDIPAISDEYLDTVFTEQANE